LDFLGLIKEHGVLPSALIVLVVSFGTFLGALTPSAIKFIDKVTVGVSQLLFEAAENTRKMPIVEERTASEVRNMAEALKETNHNLRETTNSIKDATNAITALPCKGWERPICNAPTILEIELKQLRDKHNEKF
jgi:hypothetical protein